MGSHFVLRGLFLTQRSNPGLLLCRILYCLSHQGWGPHINQKTAKPLEKVDLWVAWARQWWGDTANSPRSFETILHPPAGPGVKRKRGAGPGWVCAQSPCSGRLARLQQPPCRAPPVPAQCLCELRAACERGLWGGSRERLLAGVWRTCCRARVLPFSCMGT